MRTARAALGLTLFSALLVVAMVLYFNRNLSVSERAHNEDNFVTDCITKKVVGRIPRNLKVIPFTNQLNASAEETADQRLASFQRVFYSKEWINDGDDPNVVSGSGSSLVYSQEAIAGLHTIIGDLKREHGLSRVRLLDIPCGDMTWMSRFLKTRDDIDYTGYDIVPELIAKHRSVFASHPWTFVQHDMVEKPINDTFDLIFSRMMLQHLMTKDVLRILKRFSDSESKYLLTTTFSGISNNHDLNTNSRGRFRLLNLEIPPISLIPPICIFRDGEEGTSHFLALWKLPLKMVPACTNISAFKMNEKTYSIYSCVNWTLNS